MDYIPPEFENIALERVKGTGEDGISLAGMICHKRKDIFELADTIGVINKDLTDHSPKHIQNVVNNCGKLIDINSLNPIEHYLLLLCAYFHDLGNHYGRKEHQHYAGKCFAKIYKGDMGETIIMRLKQMVTDICQAHCGEASDKTTNTLKYVNREDYIFENTVRLQALAAVLRFADELAEGRQRTNKFLNEAGVIDPESSIYHVYADSTHIAIDSNQKRINLNYTVTLKNNVISDQNQNPYGLNIDTELEKYLDPNSANPTHA